MTNHLDFGKLSIDIVQAGTTTVYRFKGEVDESFQSKKVPHPKTPQAVFELGAIDNFNSCGIREWIYFIRDIDPSVKVTFKECSVAMIDQINMVPESKGHASIESFFAPYFSASKGEVNKLITKDQIAAIAKTGKAPAFADEGGKPLEFDALEESYFMFLTLHSASKAS